MDFGCVTIILPNAPIRLLTIFMTHPPTHPPSPLPSLEVSCLSILSGPSLTLPQQRLISPPFPLKPCDPPKIFKTPPPPHPFPPLSIEKIIFLKAFWFDGFSSINLRHVFQIIQALKIVASLRLELRAVSGSSFRLTMFFSFYEQNSHFTLTVIR